MRSEISRLRSEMSSLFRWIVVILGMWTTVMATLIP